MPTELEDLLNGILKIKQPEEKEGPRVNLDTILLADFTKPKFSEKILEIGCAHGAVSLILAKRGYAVEGVDIQPHLIELASENARLNGLDTMAEFYVGDLRDHKKIWRAQTYDRIVVNPPYDELSGSNRSPSDPIAAAMHGTKCTLEEVVVASRYLLKNRGRLDMVMRANRIGELFALLSRYNIEPKIMKTVHPRLHTPATIVLIESMRAGRHGLKIEAPLFVLGADGMETPELTQAYKIREDA